MRDRQRVCKRYSEREREREREREKKSFKIIVFLQIFYEWSLKRRGGIKR